MNKHTQGPWEIDHYGDVVANGEDVAHVVGHYGKEQNDANARLIAAAPDLLGQHESNLVELEFLFTAAAMGDPRGEVLIRVQDVIRRTRAAIAKATGEE